MHKLMYQVSRVRQGRMKFKVALLFIMLLVTFVRGVKYSLGYPLNHENADSLRLFLSTNELEDVPFLIDSLGYNISGIIRKNSSLVFDIPHSFEVRYEYQRYKGIRIKSANEKHYIRVVAQSHINFTSGIFSALPCQNQYLNEYVYYAVTWQTRRLSSLLLIVGCQNDTKVAIGSNKVVTLNDMETFLVKSYSSLTGTKFVSDKPVSVISGQQCANVPTGVQACDYIIEQFPNTALWGNRFLTSPLQGRTAPDIYVVVPSLPLTTVTFFCSKSSVSTITTVSDFPNNHTVVTIPGSFYCSVESNHPIQIAQLASGQGADNRFGDPFMMNVLPIRHYSNDYSVVVPPYLFNNTLTIFTLPDYFQPDKVFFDGQSLLNHHWTTIPCHDKGICGYAAHINVTEGHHLIHHEKYPAKLAVSVYGFTYFTGYGYYEWQLERPSSQHIRSSVGGIVGGIVPVVAIVLTSFAAVSAVAYSMKQKPGKISNENRTNPSNNRLRDQPSSTTERELQKLESNIDQKSMKYSAVRQQRVERGHRRQNSHSLREPDEGKLQTDMKELDQGNKQIEAGKANDMQEPNRGSDTNEPDQGNEKRVDQGIDDTRDPKQGGSTKKPDQKHEKKELDQGNDTRESVDKNEKREVDQENNMRELPGKEKVQNDRKELDKGKDPDEEEAKFDMRELDKEDVRFDMKESDKGKLQMNRREPYKGIFQIESQSISLGDIIGEGQFGVVYQAILGTDGHEVALKILKGTFNQKQLDCFVQESLKMSRFNHPHVMNLIGVCLDTGSAPYIVMPFMKNGSLLDFLRRERETFVLDDTTSDADKVQIQKCLLIMCSQIASGMEYLAAEKYVHRDLAARNCMIDSYFVIKISDFGLSEDVFQRNYFREGADGEATKLPVKWMAPESLSDGHFSEKSDVWSYGVTMWEIFSGGKSPYPGTNPVSLVKMLEEGERMPKPYNTACSDEIYRMMMECWEYSSDKRPSFKILYTSTSRLLVEVAGQLESNFNPFLEWEK